tara:strand:- start:380 stop:1225 length:846 start_codon:yes stop_codon:yes gene_type:complete
MVPPKDYYSHVTAENTNDAVEVGFEASTDQWWVRVETPIMMQFVKYLMRIQDKAIIVVTQTGLAARVVDAMHVSMLTVKTPDCEFDFVRQARGEDYIGDVGIVGEMYVELDDLNKCFDKDESHVTLVFKGDPFHELLVVNDDCQTTLKGIDIHTALRPRVPEVTMNTLCIVDSATLVKGAKRMADVTDNVILRATDGDVKFSAVSASISRQFNLGNQLGEDARSSYALEHLRNFINVLPTSKTGKINVRLGWNNNHPVLIDTDEDLNEWAYFLAPHIEGDA